MKPLQTLGKYELISKLGAGGMAEVFKARMTGVEGFEKVVVVKKILPGYARNLSFIKMLVDEAKLTSVLQHPNIVQIIELDSLDNQYYIAMELVDGKDLLKILARCAENKLEPSAGVACFIAAEVCKGLDYAHRAKDIYGEPLNIIHRDVSPSNIIVSWGGNVKIMDFGVAKARTQDTKGSKHVLRGKLGYMSPEQVKGEEIDHRSDIFSMGIVLLEALTLKRLFLGRTDLETLINIRDAEIEKKFEKYPFIDEPMRDILRKALARDRDARYSTALEFHDDLCEYLFEQKKRVSTASAEAFLKELFGEEAERGTLAASEAPKPAAGGGEGQAPTTSSTLVSRPSHTSPGVPKSAADEKRWIDEELGLGQTGKSEAPQSVPDIQEEVIEVARPAEAPEVPASEFASEPSSPKFGQEPSPVPPGLKGHEFKLRNTSGYIFGPVDYDNLVNLLQTGAVSEEEFVSIDGGDWKRVREITEVQALSPNQALRNKGVRPIYSGTISRTGLVRVFYQVASRNLSGKLRFNKSSAQKEFYFRRGKPRHVASNLKQELIGPFLLQRAIINEAQMNDALGKANDFGGRVGDALVSLGYVKPHELYQLLDQQFREKFLQIFSWTSGSYEFYEGVPCPIDMAPSDTNVYRYLLEGVRKHIQASELKGLFAQYEGAKVRTRKNKYVTIQELPFNSKEQRLWTQVQRQGSFGDILKEDCKTEEAQGNLYRLLLLLFQLELIEFLPQQG